MKRIILALAVLLISAASVCCGKDYSSYNKGISAFRDGSYDEAVSSLLLAISQGLDDPFVKADLALAYEKSGNVTKASEYLAAAYGESPEDPDILKRVGRYYLYAGDRITAIRYFGSAVRSSESEMTLSDLETTAYAAEIEARYGNYEEAVRLYNTLILQDYMVPEHQLLAGLCYLKEHQLDAACQYFDLMCEEEAAIPEYFLIIYHALTDRGFTEEAETYFQEGLSRCDGEGTISRGEYCADAYRLTEATKEGLSGDSVGTLLAEAELLVKNNDLEGAEDIYIMLIQRGESLEKVYNQYVILKAEQGDFEGAFRLLTFIDAGRDTAAKQDAKWNEVLLYEKMYDYKTALKKLEEYMELYSLSDTVSREYAFLSRAAAGY